MLMPFELIEPAVVLGDANDLVTSIRHEFGRVGAYVAKSLNDDAAVVRDAYSTCEAPHHS